MDHQNQRQAVDNQIETVRNFHDELFGPFALIPKTPNGDRLDFTFGYCGKLLTWNILYDNSNLRFAPDFIIPTEPETLYVPLSQFQSLQNFDSNNPQSLLLVIYELLKFYRDYQKDQVKDYANERVQFQFSVIASDQNALFLLDKAEGEIRFLIPLGVDVAAELGGLDGFPLGQNYTPTALLPYLLLIFKDVGTDPKGYPEVKLLTPPHVERLLSRMPKLPAWNDATITLDYLETTRGIVKSFLNNVRLKKKFMLTCLAAFGSPLEYDSFYFSRIAFYFNEIEAVAHFTIPDLFPEKQPVISLQSVTSSRNGKPISILFDNYPYSPRWSAEELVKRIRTFLIEKKFKDLAAEESSKEVK